MTYQLEQTIKKEKINKNLNMEIIYRVLESLYQDSPSKITNLAMKTRLNHCACKKYVNWLESLNWIKIMHAKKNTIVNITPNGTEALKHLQNILNFLDELIGANNPKDIRFCYLP